MRTAPNDTMEFTLKLRERSRVIRTLAAWQESWAYPVFYAMLCAVSGLFDKSVYLPAFAVACVLVVFSACFTKDLKTLLVPFFMTYYFLGSDNREIMIGTRANLIGIFDPPAFACVCLIGAVMVTAIFIRLGKEGIFSDAIRHRGPFLYGILALDVAFLFNGLFSSTWKPIDTLYGVLFALGLTVCYGLFGAILRRDRSPATYVSFCMVCTMCAVLVQVVVLVLQLQAAGKLFRDAGEALFPPLRRGNIQLGWGYATYISGVIVMGIPAAIYLAKDRRFSVVAYVLAFLFFGGALLTGTRSALLTGFVVLIACVLLACFRGKNQQWMRFYVLLTLLIVTVAALYVDRFVMPIRELLRELCSFFRLDLQDLKSESRLSLWKNGVQDFLSSPVFGVGFSDGGRGKMTEHSNLFNDMYHNIVVQCMGAMGALGLAALLWHAIDVGRVFFHRFSVERALLLMLPITILGTSLADNFFFCFNYQICYAAYLALAEHPAAFDAESCALLR